MRQKINGIVLLLIGVLMLGGCGSNNGKETQQELAGTGIEAAEDTQDAIKPQEEVLPTETEKTEDT